MSSLVVRPGSPGKARHAYADSMEHTLPVGPKLGTRVDKVVVECSRWTTVL